VRGRLKRILDTVERIPLGVRLAVAVLAAAVAIAATIADDRNGDGSGGGADGAQNPSTYLGPRGAQSWVPSRANARSVVWAIGDGADGGTAGRAVAGMVASHRVDRLLYLGDVYETGTASEFATNYRPLYGRFGAITAPTIGNHEWPNLATGYVPYWTAARGTPPPLRYAFAVSGWQLISLNSNLPTDPAQEAWLSREIRRTPRYGDCRIAFMHHPRYSAGLHGDLHGLEGIFEDLRGHASIALAGHDHDMQRLHPIDGITPFVDGAGGRELYPVNRDDPRLAFFDDTHHGALRIALRPGRAVLSFIDQTGRTLDSSTVTCQEV
jgi:Calcineurin-like phosphoesterase